MKNIANYNRQMHGIVGKPGQPIYIASLTMFYASVGMQLGKLKHYFSVKVAWPSKDMQRKGLI